MRLRVALGWRLTTRVGIGGLHSPSRRTFTGCTRSSSPGAPRLGTLTPRTKKYQQVSTRIGVERRRRTTAAGAGGAGPFLAPLRRRDHHRGHRPPAPGCASPFVRRAPGAAQPPVLGQRRRDRRLHGGRETHPHLLHGRRHRAKLSPQSRLRQYRAPYPLLAGAGMAGRSGDPRDGPRLSHASGLRAPVPPSNHRCEKRAGFSPPSTGVTTTAVPSPGDSAVRRPPWAQAT